MADLRDAAIACGYGDVRTYIQSGNLVFDAATGDTTAVAGSLRAAIAGAIGLTTEVIVRTRDELAAVVNDAPYAGRGADPAHLHVLFTAGVAEASISELDLAAYAPEAAIAIGRQVYLLLPGGVGRSKLALDLGRRLGDTATMRNWRTVTKLLALADATEVARPRE